MNGGSCLIPPDRWQRIKELLDRALEIDAADWPRFLEAECGADAGLRAELESLLAHDDDAGDFLEQPVVDFLGAERHDSWLGQTLGHFTIREHLAAGGMGEVYLADQQVPLRRTVAIKRIRPGMGTEGFLARFDLECRALALMNHPNVAQVYEAGATDNGDPYVALEFVDGEPITRYCANNALSLADRIALFERVCRGVEHAHQKGIIHGDLKPGNVLVTRDERARPVPKIIDFGVARLNVGGQQDETGNTGSGLWFGSPPYASPEQVAGDDDIDTRCDVYSLGALLFELLAGRPAVDPERLRKADARERRRLLIDTDPAPPSEQAAVGPPGSIRPGDLRGDLDAIVLKAMARDRQARYDAVIELRHDLVRHREHQPVRAMPPTRRYRLSRFVRRNSVSVAAGVLVVLVLLAATALTSIGFLRAVEAERVAVREAEKTREVSDFLVDIFRVSDPRQAQGRTLTARDIVDNGVRRLSDGLTGAPEIEAALLDTVGTVYMQLGLFDEARPLLDRGLALRERSVGTDHPDYAVSLRSVGLLGYYTGDYALAEQQHRQALAVNTATFGSDDARVAVNLHNIGAAVDQQGRWDEAEQLMRDALALHRRISPDDNEHVATTLNNLAGVKRRQGDRDEAVSLYREALAVRRAIGHRVHPDTATVINNIGVVELERGNLAAAATLHEQALAMQREVLGADHPATLTTLTNLASVLVRQREYDQAIPLLRQSVTLHVQAWGRDHLNTAQTLNSLGTALHQSGRPADSLEALNDAIDAFEASVGVAHPLGALARTNKATALVAVGRADEALSLAEAAIADLGQAGLPAAHPLVALAEVAQGSALAAQGRYADAEPLLVERLPIIEKAFGRDSARREALLVTIEAMYTAWGKPDQAADYAERRQGDSPD